jgi:hypothetical protein
MGAFFVAAELENVELAKHNSLLVSFRLAERRHDF